jgi:hypothetical protein
MIDNNEAEYQGAIWEVTIEEEMKPGEYITKKRRILVAAPEMIRAVQVATSLAGKNGKIIGVEQSRFEEVLIA